LCRSPEFWQRMTLMKKSWLIQYTYRFSKEVSQSPRIRKKSRLHCDVIHQFNSILVVPIYRVKLVVAVVQLLKQVVSYQRFRAINFGKNHY
jgi:hypothetical protein